MHQDIRSVIKPYRQLLQEVDAWFAKCSLVASESISCRRGCSACCRGLFDITLLDAYLLRDGFDRLYDRPRGRVRERSKKRLDDVRLIWPDYSRPYLLNVYPEVEWDLAMPEEDETPCPFLGDDGGCLVYDSRPMTCRLNGIPLVDNDGEPFFDEWCSLNFSDSDPISMPELRFGFKEIFAQEQLLFREFTRRLLGQSFNELDTLIPAVPFIDFANLLLPEKLSKHGL